MGFFNRSQQGKRIAIFHIGSGCVHAGLIELKPGNNNTFIPEILFTTHIDMPVTEVLNFSSFEQMMVEALKKVGHAMHKSHLGAPDEIMCFLGSPWYAAQTRTVKLEKSIPFTVTQKLVDDLIKKEIDSFEKEELKKYEEAGNSAKIIEREITSISLNGYPVDNAYGQQTTSIEFSLMVSMSPTIVIDKIVEQINSSYTNKKVRFHSFIYAGTLATRDLFISKDNFLFVDVGGEITDVALVKNGMVADMVSFPYGKNVLIREFAKGMGREIPEAQPILSLYRDKKLESNIQIKAEKVLNSAMGEWTKLFQTTLSHLATQFLLPDTAALTTTLDAQLFFNEAMGSDAFSQFTMTEKPFIIVSITSKALAPYVRVRAEVMLNAFIVIEAIVAARKNI